MAAAGGKPMEFAKLEQLVELILDADQVVTLAFMELGQLSLELGRVIPEPIIGSRHFRACVSSKSEEARR